MEEFLKSVEKKAFRMIQIATGNTDDAMDLLQDSMMSFVRKYSDKMESDWKPLFYRVVQNRIRDWYRREKIKRLFFIQMPPRYDGPESQTDPMESIEDKSAVDSLAVLKTSQAMEKLNNVLRGLPARQQQVFLLRSWEGLSTEETAKAMGCTQGTVKTHYFRAITKLKHELEGTWP
ncbi:MAG: RNA polymerase sigma factor [Deltaproteobacteria bacterium]|nr:RNA polymerase sigma factor [Deltaproteobacteria bacterium]